MTKMRSLTGFLLFASLLLSIAAPVFSAEQILSFSLTEKSVPIDIPGKKKGKASETVSKKKVVFGDEFFSVKDKSLERVYDFKKHRIYYINHQTKTQTEVSLFADLAFRIAALQNRIMLAATVQRAGEKSSDNLYTLESLFGLEGEKPRVELKEEKSQDGRILLLDQGEVLAEIEPSQNGPDVDARLFGRFLIYDNSMHPLIRRRILAESKIPQKFVYRLESLISKDAFSVDLKKAEFRDAVGYQVPKNYKHSSKRPGALPEATILDQLIESVRHGKDKTVKQDKAWFWKQADSSLQQKDYLNAAIYYLEYGLQSGDQEAVAAALRQVAVNQAQDTELDRLLRSLGVAGKEQALRAVEELQKLDRNKVKRPHIIDLMIANQKAVLGEREAAARAMIGALRMNPYMTAAYKDLGDLFYGQLDMATAWLCWDFARELEPQHFMLRPISDYEKELLNNYPDFF